MVSQVQPQIANPLAKHFRQPEVYIDLPSQGKFYPQGALATNKQLAVLPMTALDEINLKTPDALYNGTSMVNLIKSCVPSIVDPWSIPMLDFDTVLLGIKIASMGNQTEVTSTCPECKEENSFTADLGRLLSSIRAPNYDQVFTVGDLNIYFKPLTYKQVSENSIWQVDQQRKINQITASTQLTDTEKANQLNDIWLQITRATIDIVAMGIDTVKTLDAVVRDYNQIREFMHNCPQEMYTSIKNQAIALRDQSELKPLHVKCTSCQHEYDQPFVLDQSNFFA
jgi:hypothetical protein